MMTLNLFLWEPQSAEESQNRARKNMPNNGWETAMIHCTQHTIRKTRQMSKHTQ